MFPINIAASLAGRLALALCISLWFIAPCRGEVKLIKLPFESRGFAFNPQLGDLATIDPPKNRAVLFRRANLNARNAGKTEEIQTGAAPSCVCFKQFGDQSLFIVGSRNEKTLYVIDAIKFELKQKVSLAMGPIGVMVSLNAADPFVYYIDGRGLNAVDLRTLVDRGMIIPGTGAGAVSADGLVIYRRDSHNDREFELLQCTSGLEVDKPNFITSLRKQEFTRLYFPDPMNRFTAVNGTLYSKSLEHKLGSFDFPPVAYSVKRPFLFGVVSNSTLEASFENTPIDVTVKVASYNTMKPVGQKLVLSSPSPDSARRPRFRPASEDEFSLRQELLIVDDLRSALIYANKSHIFLVDMEDLKLPDEPLLAATLQGPNELFTGQKQEFELKVSDTRTIMTAESIPNGAVFEKGKLRWTPTSDQIGVTDLKFKLKVGEFETTAQFLRNVTYPSLKLPFQAHAAMGDDHSSLILVWNFPQSLENRTRTANAAPAADCKLAVIDWNKRQVLATATCNRPIRLAKIAGDLIMLLFSDDYTASEIWDAKQLKRLKLLNASKPILRSYADNLSVILAGEDIVEIYDRTTWKRKQTFSVADPNQNIYGQALSDSEHGVILNGVLCDYLGKPLLNAGPLFMPKVGTFDLPLFGTTYGDPKRMLSNRGNESNPLVKRIPETSQTASILIGGSTPDVINRPDSSAPTAKTLTLQIKGDEIENIELSKKPRDTYVNHNVPYQLIPTLIVGTKKASVVDGDRLYFWNSPETGIKATQPLTWTLKQSTFIVPADKSTTLTHTIQGGKTPYEFHLLTPMPGLEIDEKTGTIQVDGVVLHKYLESQLSVDKQLQVQLRQLIGNAKTQEMTSDVQRLLKLRANGQPLAVMIRIRASDANDQSATLQYAVLADLPLATVQAKLQAAEQPAGSENGAAVSGASRQQAGTMPSTRELQEQLDRINKRVEGLEARIDLLIQTLAKQEQKPKQEKPVKVP